MEVASIDELIVFARSFLAKIESVEGREAAYVVALYGDLGAGKTTLVQTIARELHITDSITSPTYVIRKAYDIPSHPLFSRVIHIDAYRLEKEEELSALNFKDDISDPRNLIFIEWADKVEGLLPEDTHTLRLTFMNETTRDIKDDNE